MPKVPKAEARMSPMQYMPFVEQNEPVEHTDDECMCGPTTIPVPRADGSIGWVVMHHPLLADTRRPTQAQLETLGRLLGAADPTDWFPDD
jgi:hypothetical protein